MLKKIILTSALILALSATDLFPFGKNKVNRDVFDWDIMQTLHFDIYYPHGMENLANYTAGISEEGCVHISNYLNHELTQVIPVIVYPSHIDFQENNIFPDIIDEGIGGFTEAFKNRVVIPFTGSYRDFRHVLTHELVHAFQYNILFYDISGEQMSRFDPIPLWIVEGMAEYISIGFDDTADMTMRDILYNEKYATLMDLTQLNVESGYLLYKEGQAFFYFLEKVYGRDRIGEILRDIRDLGGYSGFDDVIKINTGKELEDLNLEWIRFYKKRYFPVVKDKIFDEEAGEQLTFHQKTRTTYNHCPAVSPDGKKIAFITNHEIYSSLAVIDIKKNKDKKREISTLITGDISAQFEGMHLLSNNISWSRDGAYISFVSQSNGRDVIFLVNPEDGEIIKEIKLPFRAVSDPALSPDGSSVAFIGQKNDSADVYIYIILKNELQRVTSDLFSERYPKLSSDNNFIIFSSNWNDKGDYEKDDYNIYKINLSAGEKSLLIEGQGNDLQADISADNRRIIYISNRTGIYNAYICNLESKENIQITNVLCGIFFPRWFPDEKKIAFVAYQNLGFDIFIKDIIEPDKFPVSRTRETEYMPVSFAPSYFNLKDSVFNEYSPKIDTDLILPYLFITRGYGFAAVQLMLSDYLGENRIILTSDYFRYEDNNDLNFDIAYYYLKYRWDFGFGIFRQKNPLGLFSLNTINELIHNVYWDTLYMNKYGTYGIASYPFSRFSRMDLQATFARDEIDYSRNSERHDVFTNQNSLALSLVYDNVLWGFLAPADGFRGAVSFEKSFDVTDKDTIYSSVDIDLRRYFLLNKKYVFAFRGRGGRIFGRDSDLYRYYIGGFYTLRGHPLFEYSGKNMFLGNAEFRFIFIEGIKFGWPLFFQIGGIGGALFADFGSAWDHSWDFIENDTGKFSDFKADIGYGLRFTLYPVIIFKLDFAWPYYYNSFGKRELLISLGFEY